MEQIILNFDASEFDGFDRTQEYFAFRTRTIRDEGGRPVKQCVQAMELDFSPSQWSQKLCESNNTTITLNDADKHTEIFGEVGWIHFLVQKHIINKKQNREALLKLRKEIDAQLAHEN